MKPKSRRIPTRPWQSRVIGLSCLGLFYLGLANSIAGPAQAGPAPVIRAAEPQVVNWDRSALIRPEDSLQARLDGAHPGDTLKLAAGIFTGNFVCALPVTLIGRGDSTRLDGNGQGRVLTLTAPDVVVENLTVENSAQDVGRQAAGIWVEKTATNARLSGLRVRHCAFGIWLNAVEHPMVNNCRIEGQPPGKFVEDRGNGIHLFKVEGGTIAANRITLGRDGIYISNSQGCLLKANRISHVRFAIHYMYSHENTVQDNIVDSSSVGLALMYSKDLDIIGNEVRTCYTHGLMLRNLYASRITGNATWDSHDGIFFNGCNFDTLRDNRVMGNQIGISVNDSRHNVVQSNWFAFNRQQLDFLDNITMVWGGPKGGNYWSEYVGWDADGDGYGDRPHRPAGLLSYLVSRYEPVRRMLHSPALKLLQGLEGRFPQLQPPGVEEPHPLMPNRTDRAALAGWMQEKKESKHGI